MSEDNVKKFFDALKKDENLNKNYLDAMKECHEQAGKIIVDGLVNFASGHGFPFTAEDLIDMESLKSNGELSSEELATFSGGTAGSYLGAAQRIAMLAANAINAQQQATLISQAQTTQAVTQLYSLDKS